MRDVCRAFAAGTPANTTASLLTNALQLELKQVARAFVELQDARHNADYDLAISFDRLDVLQKIAMAERAFSAWHSIRSEPNSFVFLAALLLQHQWR
jgi:hypothetical protein